MTRPTAREENPGSARDYSRIETLNRIYKRNDGIYASACQRMHLPASVFDVLYALCITDGLTQKEICDACFAASRPSIRPSPACRRKAACAPSAAPAAACASSSRPKAARSPTARSRP